MIRGGVHSSSSVLSFTSSKAEPVFFPWPSLFLISHFFWRFVSQYGNYFLNAPHFWCSFGNKNKNIITIHLGQPRHFSLASQRNDSTRNTRLKRTLARSFVRSLSCLLLRHRTAVATYNQLIGRTKNNLLFFQFLFAVSASRPDFAPHFLASSWFSRQT